MSGDDNSARKREIAQLRIELGALNSERSQVRSLQRQSYLRERVVLREARLRELGERP
jgi:hypothetical protein